MKLLKPIPKQVVIRVNLRTYIGSKPGKSKTFTVYEATLDEVKKAFIKAMGGAK